jgi:hypothetical protein
MSAYGMDPAACPVAASNRAKFIELLKEGSGRRPVVLVIGGGTVGLGADELYRNHSIELVGTDALGAGDKLSFLIALPFFWIRFLDRFARDRAIADAASGFFFLGRRSDLVIAIPTR